VTCEVFRQTLDDAFDLVDAGVVGPLREHAATCSACDALLQQRLRFEQTLTVAMLQPAKRTKPVKATRPWIRYAAVAATTVLGLLAGHRYGVGDLENEKDGAVQRAIKTMVPPVLAADVPAFSSLLRLPGLGSDDSEFSGWQGKEDSPLPMGPIDWGMLDSSSKDFVMIDPNVGHSRPGSIKLLQRHYGGTARRKVSMPLGPDSVIRLSCWVLCPYGGSVQNKYLSFGISGGVASKAKLGNNLNVFDANPNWRPYWIETSIPQAIDYFEISFSTGAGDGNFRGYDWASWIDDIAIEVIASYPVKIVSAIGDELDFDIVAPGVAFSDLRAVSSRQGFADVIVTPIPGHENRYRVKSVAVIEELRSPNPFAGKESPLGIRGKATIGSQTVNFSGGAVLGQARGPVID